MPSSVATGLLQPSPLFLSVPPPGDHTDLPSQPPSLFYPSPQPQQAFPRNPQNSCQGRWANCRSSPPAPFLQVQSPVSSPDPQQTFYCGLTPCTHRQETKQILVMHPAFLSGHQKNVLPGSTQSQHPPKKQRWQQTPRNRAQTGSDISTWNYNLPKPRCLESSQSITHNQ